MFQMHETSFSLQRRIVAYIPNEIITNSVKDLLG